ncbi:endonuclease domain-containing protein [Microbacterium sp. TWP3-1-2b2]|uniref:endonuclease domain-containing protein n=1 Tax=Microbacterium sp. TWP3-1-2b2 TaxID=2804651 RepID=UPI003CEF9FE2
MRARDRLPRTLGESFSIREAEEAGVGRSRRNSPDLDRPFHGVRATAQPKTLAEFVYSYHRRMKRGHRYGGRTGMRLWGLPLPQLWTAEEPLVVMVMPDAAPPKTGGVRGRRLASDRAETTTLKGVPVVDPVAAFFTCAAELTVAQAVVVIDALITTASDYPGLGPRRPMTTPQMIADRLVQWGRFPGCATVRTALPLARERVESPKETETRLLIVTAGLPEPLIQFEVHDGGRLVGRVDLAYPELKIAIEYEGDGHRTDKAQWRRDVQRQRELEALGWIVIRLTEDDLKDGGASLLASLRRALATRSRA